MENITGTQIISNQYGLGTIISINDGMVMTISFPEVGEKLVLFKPSAKHCVIGSIPPVLPSSMATDGTMQAIGYK